MGLQKVSHLYNIQGNHIGNFVDDKWLYSVRGRFVGYLFSKNTFVDLKGYYLGEIIFDNRLLASKIRLTRMEWLDCPLTEEVYTPRKEDIQTIHSAEKWGAFKPNEVKDFTDIAVDKLFIE